MVFTIMVVSKHGILCGVLKTYYGTEELEENVKDNINIFITFYIFVYYGERTCF